MALRRPLVIVGDQVRQLPAADDLDPTTLGTGTPSLSTFLRGDGTWAAPTLGTPLRTAITSAVTGGSNSTADVAFATLTVPANTLVVGDLFDVRAIGTTSNGTTATNVVFWIIVNGTTRHVLSTNAMGTTAASGVFFELSALITVQAIGTAGSLAINGRTIWKAASLGLGAGSFASPNTTAAFTLSVGANLSVAGASNSVTAQQARIALL